MICFTAEFENFTIQNSTSPLLAITNCIGTTVENIGFDGGTNQLDIDNSSEVIVSFCFMQNATNNAIEVDLTTQVNFANTIIKNCANDGVNFDSCRNVILDGINISNCDNDGVVIGGVVTNDLLINDLDFN